MSMSQATQETDDALDQESMRRHEHAFLTEQLNETMPSRGLERMPGLGAKGHILTAITVSKADETTRQVVSEVPIED